MNIIWFSEIKWDYLKTRKQQIISRKPSDSKLLFLEPFVKGRANNYRLRKEGDIFCATVPFVKAVPSPPLRWFLDWEGVPDYSSNTTLKVLPMVLFGDPCGTCHSSCVIAGSHCGYTIS